MNVNCHAFYGFISHDSHAFMGNILTIFLSHASIESMEISPWKPWSFALTPCSMVFKGINGFSHNFPCFSIDFPCFFRGFPMLSAPGICKQQVVDSNSTQAQCNFSSEELHWVSHGVVGRKCQYFTLAHSNIISWLLSPQRLGGWPYLYFTLTSPLILISPVANPK